MLPQPTSQIGHHHKVTNTTMSPTSQSPLEGLSYTSANHKQKRELKQYKICTNTCLIAYSCC